MKQLIYIIVFALAFTLAGCHKSPSIHVDTDYFQQDSYYHRGFVDVDGVFQEGYIDSQEIYHSFNTQQAIETVEYEGVIYNVQDASEFGLTTLWFHVYNTGWCQVSYYEIKFSVLLSNGEWLNVSSDGYNLRDDDYQSVIFDAGGKQVTKILVMGAVAF